MQRSSDQVQTFLLAGTGVSGANVVVQRDFFVLGKGLENAFIIGRLR
jgi:hypothetical protein